MLTQCPQCEARFRVQEQQLQAAKGKVRCGRCMTVFNALANLVSENELPEESPAESRQPATHDELSPAASSTPHPFVRALERQKTEADSEPAPENEQPVPPAGNMAGAKADDEELIFQDDPEEDQTEAGYTGSGFNDTQLSDSFRELEVSDNNYLFAEEAESEEAITTDESWAEEILREDQPKPQPPPALASSTQTFSLSAPENSNNPLLQPNAGDSALRADPKPGYEKYRPSPIQVTEPGDYPRQFSIRKLLLGAFIFLLVILLLVQLGRHHYDKLARYDSIRPIYTTVCKQLLDLGVDCSLPSLVNLAQIRSENLIVRSHPLTRDALIIDAVLFNDASFPQPYPAINLSFADINNNVVASRVFQPEDYLPLAQELPEQLPSREPLRISLELKDPGKQAVNYTMSFLNASVEPDPKSL